MAGFDLDLRIELCVFPSFVESCRSSPLNQAGFVERIELWFGLLKGMRNYGWVC